MTWNEFKAAIDQQLKELAQDMNDPSIANGETEIEYIDVSGFGIELLEVHIEYGQMKIF